MFLNHRPTLTLVEILAIFNRNVISEFCCEKSNMMYIYVYIYIISVKLTGYSTPGSYSAEPLIKVQMQQGLPFSKDIIKGQNLSCQIIMKTNQ